MQLQCYVLQRIILTEVQEWGMHAEHEDTQSMIL
jgi:hypothetical protein